MRKLFTSIVLFYSINNYADHQADKIRAIHEQNPCYVEFTFADMLGNLKSIKRPIKYLSGDIQRGIFIDGSSIVGCKGVAESDMLLLPDLDTARSIPWTNGPNKLASLMCDLCLDTQTPAPTDPRGILRKIINDAADMGYLFIAGPELEFFVFNKDSLNPCDNNGYIATEDNCNAPNIETQVLNFFNALDIQPQKIHHEVAPGQYEIVLHHDEAMKMADKLVIAKQTLKMLANLYNLRVSFMPKPFIDKNGSGMHIHFSLVDKESGKNIFYQEDNEIYLSSIGRSFIAGILHHAQEMALLFNSTVNSYKRLVAGFEAPIYVCCGTKNRSALIRIPQISPDETQAARAEIRCPDPLCNPYLALAALLAAGIDGIKNNMQLTLTSENLYKLNPDELEAKNIKTLPASLKEAIEYFEASEFMKSVLGEELFSRYLEEKKKELRAFNLAITDWELARYL